jgi:hypothetical protein
MPYTGTVMLWADGRVSTSDREIPHYVQDTVSVPVMEGTDIDPESPRYGSPTFGLALFRRTGIDGDGRCIYRQVP